MPMPRIIEPPGLSAERAWYLYEQIREHCDTDFQDATCPKPSVPKQKGSKCLTFATVGMSSIESNSNLRKSNSRLIMVVIFMSNHRFPWSDILEFRKAYERHPENLYTDAYTYKSQVLVYI